MSRYGDGATPFHETQPPRPKDPYAIAKVAAEETLKALCETHGTEYVIAVPHNIVGPRQKYDDPFRNVAAIMANRLLLGKDPIVYGDGSQTRCFSDVRDVLPVLCEFATKQGIAGQTFNVGPDEQVVSILELSKMMCRIVGKDWSPLHLPDRPREVAHAFCSSNKIRQWFGYKTRYSLEETLTSLVEYVKERGPKPFSYYLPVEIVNSKTPKFWTKEVE
jgi:UDP-glucose 4-epimerase